MSTDQHGDAGEPETFGRLLRRRRVVAGLTQDELAERARLSVRAIRDLERGATARPYRHSISKLAAALGLTGTGLAEFTRVARGVQAGDGPAPGEPGPPAQDQAPGQLPDTPRQLPGVTADFTGREVELTTLAGLLDRGDDPPGTMIVSAIGGTAGVGKPKLEN